MEKEECVLVKTKNCTCLVSMLRIRAKYFANACLLLYPNQHGVAISYKQDTGFGSS